MKEKKTIKKEKKLLKTGALESFLSDNQKLYFKKKTFLSSIAMLEKVTEKKCHKLFWFLYNNWDKILDIYFWNNKGNIETMKPIKFIIPEKKFNDITETIKGKFDTITIAFSSHQEFLILTCKQPEKKETKKIN